MSDKHLIGMSITELNDIATPTDGINYPDSNADKNISAGVQQVWFKNLNAGTYYSKVFSYTESGATTNYKTDGIVPQMSVTIP